VLSLALELGIVATVQSAQVAPWHPGRCAQITVAGQVIGTAGELAPRTAAACGVPPRTTAFEIDADALTALAVTVPAAPGISTHPVAKEDIALVVAAETPAAAVLQQIVAAAGDLLEEARLFDVYQGPQVPLGSKSLAFNLRLRAPDRTLSAGEVAAVRQNVVAACQEQFGAVLRG
jgi:phenylalanyl-tRNA synthetase beta chain